MEIMVDYLISQKAQKSAQRIDITKNTASIYLSLVIDKDITIWRDETSNVIRRESAKVIAKVGHSLAGAICILGCNLRKLKG